MNILVCFKAVPDVEMLRDEDWELDDTLQVDTSFLKKDLNSYDESALEMALKLLDGAEETGVPVELGALTIAGKEAKTLLKTLTALRFNRVVRVDNQGDIRFKPAAIAAIIAQYVLQHAAQDVLILGRQSGIGENAKTPLLVAEMLGWPCISQAIKIELLGNSRLSVTSQTDDGFIRQKVRAPCVISIGDSPGNSMRVPTLKDRVHYGKRSILTLSMDDFQLPDETEQLVGLSVVRHEREGILIEGRDPEQKAKKLYEDHLKPLLSLERQVRI